MVYNVFAFTLAFTAQLTDPSPETRQAEKWGLKRGAPGPAH